MHFLEHASMYIFRQQGIPACGRSSPSMGFLNNMELSLAAMLNALPSSG
jgi:hypothetical protein